MCVFLIACTLFTLHLLISIQTGGELCAFKVEDPNDNMTEYICFSLACKPHLHVGALHNGDFKSPNATGNGAHAQFLVTVHDNIKY